MKQFAKKHNFDKTFALICLNIALLGLAIFFMRQTGNVLWAFLVGAALGYLAYDGYTYYRDASERGWGNHKH